jgi:tetratricopeptide (TPR) repeat protein
MTTQQQEQQTNQQHAQGKQRRRLSHRALVIVTVLFIAVAVMITWILSYLNVIPSYWAPIFTIIITVLGVVFAFLQSMHLFIPTEKHESSDTSPHSSTSTYIAMALPTEAPSSAKPSHRGIVGLPPPTDSRTIQQRERVVKEVYTQLTQRDITAIALTGIGGAGKSTLAALIYRYAEEQRQMHSSPFLAETIWLTVDQATTFADLVGNLLEALGKPLPELSHLAPQNQAVALFNSLNATDKPCLVFLDQFENLLDWETGHALTDRPGVGEWLDIINSQHCVCRILLTSRPRPVGTRKYPPTYLQEYPVGGLEVTEGIALLRNRGVQGTESELRTAVTYCEGHAFSLTLLASLMNEHRMSLTTLFKNSSLWIGDIATNLLDRIYTAQLSDMQRELLRAFSVYREPVPLEVALAIINNPIRSQVSAALKTLLTQHLLEAVGEGRYQLHAILAQYVQEHFAESDKEANLQALRVAHTQAGRYYLQQSEVHCPPREKRHRRSDVHDLIEAIWHYCQAEQWQEAYRLMVKESIFDDLSRWGENAVLLELYQLLSLEQWQPADVHKAYISIDLGEVYRVLGQNEQALMYLEQGLDICQKIGDRAGAGRALTYLGRVHNPLGNKNKAKAYYKQALSVLKEVGDRAGEGLVVINLGWIYFDLGQMSRALGCYEQGLKIYQEAGDRKGEAPTHYSIGNIYLEFGQIERALDYFMQSLSICREVADRGLEGIVLSHLGLAYNAIGKQELEIKYCQEGLSISREIGDRSREGWSLYNFGCVYQSLGEKEHAISLYEQALSILRETGDRRGEARALSHLGWIYSRLDQQDWAKKYSLKGLSILREVEDHWGEAEVLHQVGLLYYEQTSHDVALSFFLLAARFFKEAKGSYMREIEQSIDILREKIGEEQFTALLATVEPQAQQIVDKILRNGLQ